MRKNSLMLLILAFLISIMGLGCDDGEQCPAMEEWSKQVLEESKVLKTCMPRMYGGESLAGDLGCNHQVSQKCKDSCNMVAEAVPPPAVTEACSPGVPAPQCPPGVGENTDPIGCDSGTGVGGGAENFNEARIELGAIRNEELGSEFDLNKAAPSSRSKIARSSDTNAGSSAKNDNASKFFSPTLGASKGTGGSVGSLTGDSSDEKIAKSDQGSREPAAIEEEKKTLINGSRFGEVSKKGASKNGGDDFSGLFGKHEERTGEGGVSSVGFTAGSDAGAMDLDAYLKIVGNDSLFVRANKQFDRFGTSLESSARSISGFGNGSAF